MTRFAEYMDAIVESGKGNFLTMEIRDMAHGANDDFLRFVVKLASLIWAEYVVPAMQ